MIKGKYAGGLVLAGLLTICSSQAQNLSWQWAKSGSNASRALATGVSMDASGNVYAIGNFTGAITFDTSNYNAHANQYIYLLKYNASGKLLWSRSISGTGAISANAVLADHDGDVYVAGYFTNEIVLGNGAISSVGGKDVFIVKYSKEGTKLWYNTHGSAYDDEVQGGIAVDSKNNLIISGYFGDKGPSPKMPCQIAFDNYTLRSTGNSDIFLAKFSSDGATIWARNSKYQVHEHASNLAIDKNDNLYVIGDFVGQLSFDTVLLSGQQFGSFWTSVFLAKYDSSGAPLWVNTVCGRATTSGWGSVSPSLTGNSVALDSAGNAIIGGSFSNCIVLFDALGTYDQSAGHIWFAKYSSSGKIIWSNSRANTAGVDHLSGLKCDAGGNIYICDQTESSLLFVAKYLPNGQPLWEQTVDASWGAVAADIELGQPDEVVIAGRFPAEGIRFGNSICFNDGPGTNGFVAKLGPATTSVKQPAEAAFSLYPNPANKLLYLKIKQAGMYDRYFLRNILGQIVASGALRPLQVQTISLADLRDGMYYLNVQGKDRGEGEMLMVEH